MQECFDHGSFTWRNLMPILKHARSLTRPNGLDRVLAPDIDRNVKYSDDIVGLRFGDVE
jgi:hypothetical protein